MEKGGYMPNYFSEIVFPPKPKSIVVEQKVDQTLSTQSPPLVQNSQQDCSKASAKFPVNPFEDIKPSDFNKLNKKHVTEDFVEENFKNFGWEVYKPFNDTGIDRIILKIVCPKGHTKVNENLGNKNCPVCNSGGVEITRFVQVKTRQLKNDIFGFTLKSKDIRIDPRHVYLLYSDKTTENSQDFLIVPVKEYLAFFASAAINPFSNTSFRKGNNKLNSLKYDPRKDAWSWGKYSWEQFRNTKGLEKIQSSEIDLNLIKLIIETRHLADKLQREFTKGSSYSLKTEQAINQELKSKLKQYSSKNEIIKLREIVTKYLEKKCDPETLDSMHKYFEFIKTLDTLGEEDLNEQ